MSRVGFIRVISSVSDTIFGRESSEHGLYHKNSQNIFIYSICIYVYIYIHITMLGESGPTQVGWTIADQPRTNRRFIDMLWKLNWPGLSRLWTLLFWFFFAIGYHYDWTQVADKRLKTTYHAIILISPLTILDSHTTNGCLNHKPIANQCPFIIFRLANTMGSNIYCVLMLVSWVAGVPPNHHLSFHG